MSNRSNAEYSISEEVFRMNDIREIVTKAVIGKGKKRFKITSPLDDLRSSADSILGCWIINHKFGARKCEDSVEVKGAYDINVWYSFADNTQTEVARQTVEYEDQVNVHRTIRDCLYEGDEVMARTLQQPTCVDARIEDGEIVVEVEFEIVVEIIGETKMRVSILGPVESVPMSDDEDDDDLDIDDQINTNFLKTSSFRE